MREHVWIIDGHPIAVRLKDGAPQVAHELPDPMRPADEGWHDFGGAHTLEDDFATEILRLAEENARLRVFVTEWSERFGFLARTSPRDSFESIDEVAGLLGTEIAEGGRFVLDMKEALGRLEAAVSRACGSAHPTPPDQEAGPRE